MLVMANYFGIAQIDQFVKNFLIDKTNYEQKKLMFSEGHSILIDEHNYIKIDEDLTSLGENRTFIDIEEEEENEAQLNEKEKFDSEDDEELREFAQKVEFESKNEIEKIERQNGGEPEIVSKQPGTYNFFMGQAPNRLESIPLPQNLPGPRPQIDVSIVMEKKCKCHNHQNETDETVTTDNEDSVTGGLKNLGICLMCHKNKADRVIVPCGHKVICKECADQITAEKAQCAENSGEKFDHICPLCDVPIQKCTEEFYEKKCVICLDNDSDTIILPCGHRCICYECATHLWTEKKQCPLCQARLLTFRHMFQIYDNDSVIEEK